MIRHFQIELIEIDEKRCRVLRLRMRNDEMMNGTIVLQKLKGVRIKLLPYTNFYLEVYAAK